ncbi:MAG TPA: adenylate/guanylate cyclase domain-containing protein [Stellaceae bacterium]|nr:adenylate/guanylate cyclase domain-containing protein [Stellaceae bacterium]
MGLSSADWLGQARASERAGQLFKAYDLALQGLGEHPEDVALKHRAVLCLARAGATRLAQRRYVEFGLAAASDLEDVAALAARLAKDEALAALPGERAAKAAAAAADYLAIFRRTGGTYPAINAATLTLLAGDPAGAASLAHEVVAALGDDDGGDYYRVATRIEALLLLGDVAAALAVAPQVRALAGDDQAALSTTWKQLRLVLDRKRLDPTGFAAVFAPAKVIHYAGHMISTSGRHARFVPAEEPAVRERIAAHLDAETVGAGYGSLASGADILFAEALIARGIGLHVVLPFDRDEFVELSVRPSGEEWAERFEACIAKAASLRLATEDRYLGDDLLFANCSRLAMGLARLHARHLGAAVEQVAVWDGEAAIGPAGTAADVASWRRRGLPQTIIPVSGSRTAPATPGPARAGAGRVVRAMLFCDIKGFSRLTDSELPRYVGEMLGALGRVVNLYRADVSFGNTWGDGLFLVFEDATRAASCALELQDVVTRLDLPALGLPPHLGMRVGGHVGPVYAAFDPVLQTTNYFGAHVSRAARIEPVTPPGCVYVTEPFAATLAFEAAEDFTCDYVGVTEAAKHYGAMRMFLLHRSGLA